MAPDTENTFKSAGTAIENGQEHLKTVAQHAYLGEKKESIDDARITDLLPMVRKIAQRVVTYLRPPLSFDDLVSAGAIGLVKAARDYDPSYQAEFKTYAYTRIKGAILDELRSFSLLPSNVNEQVRKLMELSELIFKDTGTTPTEADLAEKLGMTVDQVYDTFINARARHFLSMDGFVKGEPGLDSITSSIKIKKPDEQAERTELINNLAQAIQQLPGRQKKIILLYYHQQLTMKQIAEVLEVSEARVSQMHAAAVVSLSLKLKDFNDGRE